MTAVVARAGRPRSAEADEAILEATTALFSERGYEGLSIEAVAERAGVAKSTVYRRYPGKADLVIAATKHCASAVAPVGPGFDTGSLEGDLLEAARHVRRVLTSTAVGRVLPAATAAAARHPEFGRLHRQFVNERRAAVVDAVRRGIRRGEVPAGTNPDLLVDLVIGPVFYRVFNTGGRVDDRSLRELVRRAVKAFA